MDAQWTVYAAGVNLIKCTCFEGYSSLPASIAQFLASLEVDFAAESINRLWLPNLNMLAVPPFKVVIGLDLGFAVAHGLVLVFFGHDSEVAVLASTRFMRRCDAESSVVLDVLRPVCAVAAGDLFSSPCLSSMGASSLGIATRTPGCTAQGLNYAAGFVAGSFIGVGMGL